METEPTDHEVEQAWQRLMLERILDKVSMLTAYHALVTLRGDDASSSVYADIKATREELLDLLCQGLGIELKEDSAEQAKEEPE